VGQPVHTLENSKIGSLPPDLIQERHVGCSSTDRNKELIQGDTKALPYQLNLFNSLFIESLLCSSQSRTKTHFCFTRSDIQSHRFFRNLRPGLSLFRNSIPAFSKTPTTLESVSVLDPIGPSKLSIRWIVPKATFDFFDNSLWDQPRRARAALT
jgi:hypothetical protein